MRFIHQVILGLENHHEKYLKPLEKCLVTKFEKIEEISEKVSKELQLVKEKCLMIGNDIRIDGGFAANSDIDFIWFNSKNEQGNCPKMIANINVYTELIEKWGEIID